MDVGASLVADDESTEPMQPGKGSLDDPAVAAQAFRRFDATTGDARNDAPGATGVPGLARIVGLVGVQLARSETRAADRLWDGRHAVEQRLQQRRVGHVRRAQLDREGDALAIDEDVV